jgi:hypothetical protein
MHESHKKYDDEVLFNSIDNTGNGFYWTVGGLVAVIMFAFYAFINQVLFGLGVTGLAQPVSWGFYIINFVFLSRVAATNNPYGGSNNCHRAGHRWHTSYN